nr:D-3-phosphoglycerate dehydrogenase 1, chloroplastic-like [Tanacetum cinerariifolium]
VASILGKENVNISTMGVYRAAPRKQAVMVFAVDEKPSEEALKKIDEIPAVEEFVFLTKKLKLAALMLPPFFISCAGPGIRWSRKKLFVGCDIEATETENNTGGEGKKFMDFGQID